MKRLHVIDSHTGGEPTRLVMSGFPALVGDTIADQLEHLRTHHDQWRRACLLEPRGNDVLVGALYCAPVTPGASQRPSPATSACACKPKRATAASMRTGSPVQPQPTSRAAAASSSSSEGDSRPEVPAAR